MGDLCAVWVVNQALAAMQACEQKRVSLATLRLVEQQGSIRSTPLGNGPLYP